MMYVRCFKNQWPISSVYRDMHREHKFNRQRMVVHSNLHVKLKISSLSFSFHFGESLSICSRGDVIATVSIAIVPRLRCVRLIRAEYTIPLLFLSFFCCFFSFQFIVLKKSQHQMASTVCSSSFQLCVIVWYATMHTYSHLYLWFWWKPNIIGISPICFFFCTNIGFDAIQC